MPAAAAESGRLEINPATWSKQDVYRLHASLIIPRPIAWVSTLSAADVPNLAPHSYFNAVCDDPPMVMFVVEGEKDTYRNVADTGEFVVNLVSVSLARAMELTAVDFPGEIDEAPFAGLHWTASTSVRPARVAEAKAAMECVVDRIIHLGTCNHMIIGKVVRYVLCRDVIINGRVDPLRLDPLGRIGGGYVEIGAAFRLTRPEAAKALAEGEGAALNLVVRTELGARRFRPDPE
jgi:flavin reductase (DIM6/NTAB) family NADH-FMN oxidoreductase RutF